MRFSEPHVFSRALVKWREWWPGTFTPSGGAGPRNLDKMMRNGKIARLPREIRNQLNQRLDHGESGETLLPWLNGLPEVQTVLNRQFDGAAISKQNLHEWRTGGFAEWLARQEMLADARELAADADEMNSATEGRLAEHLATVLAARYASALAGWDGQPTEEFRQKLKILRSLCRDIAELRRADHGGRKLQLEQDRIEEQREKTEAEVVAKFEHWAKIPAVQDWLCQTWVPIEERLRRKRELFELPPEEGVDDAEADQESDKDDVEAEGEAPGSNPVKVVFPKARPNRVPPPRTPPMKPPRQPLAGRAVPDPRSLRGSLTYYPALLTRASVLAPVECAGKAPAATALSPHPSMKPHGYHRPVATRPAKTLLRGIYGEAPWTRRADGPGGWTASALRSFAGRKS